MKIATTQTLKFKKLQRRLKLPLWQAIGVLEAIWKMTYRNAPGGDIGRLSNEDIAAAIEWEGDADDLIAGLVETGWVDTDPTHRLLIHDWEQECESWHRGHMERYGKSFARPQNQEQNKPCTELESSLMQPSATLGTSASLPIPTLPSPSPPILNPPAPDPEPLSAAWVEVVGVLKKEGMGGAEQVCETCRDNGCGVHEATRVIEHWQKNKPRWGVGLLYKRLEFMRPGERHLRGWPDDGGTVGYEQVTADEFREFGRLRQFKKAPDRNKSSPTWVFGELRDGRKVECRDYPLPEKTSPPLEATSGPE